MPHFQHRASRIQFVQHGNGQTLLLIHGAGGNAMNWPPGLRRLPGWSVAAIDLPGHGKSIDAPALTSIGEYCALVLAWADALGVEKFAVAGQSMGAAIALQVALDVPERVTHLIPIACAPKIVVNPALLDALHAGDASAYTTLTRLSYARETLPKRLAQYEMHLRNTPPHVLWAAFSACAVFDIADRLGEIAAPTLVIGAVKDRMIPMQGSIALHNGIAGS